LIVSLLTCKEDLCLIGVLIKLAVSQEKELVFASRIEDVDGIRDFLGPWYVGEDLLLLLRSRQLFLHQIPCGLAPKEY
jgi:hypothetical protein